MSKEILLYIPQLNSRVEYVFKLIFKDLLSFDTLIFSSNSLEFKNSAAKIKISYGAFFDESIPFFPKESDLLFETGIQSAVPTINNGTIYPCAFHTIDKRSILPFDFPALAFYLLTRYEEYQVFQCDKHERFPASESLAYRAGFLERPLIDLWARELYHKLVLHFGAEKLPELPGFSFQPSYDIDYAWAYLNKGFWRAAAAMVKNIISGNFSELSHRLKVCMGREADPYFTFNYLDQLHQQYPNLDPLYFFLLGNYGAFDKNSSAKNPNFRQLIKDTGSKYQVGIHPSYRSNKEAAMLTTEIARLEAILGVMPEKSRQHFLKLKFPTSYQKLLKVGIKADYTMGYANTIGFRASIARAFYWYDLSTEKETKLRIHPFMFMDVTLKDYMKLSGEEVLERIGPMIEETRAVGGELCCIWHNNSFSEQGAWQGWRAVYEDILKAVEGA